MPWNLKNVALDPAYAGKRRIAAKMDMEPIIAGVRIRLRQQVTISDEMYETNKVRIGSCVAKGVLIAIPSEPAKKTTSAASEPAPAGEPAPEPEPAAEPAPLTEPEPTPEQPAAPTPAPEEAAKKPARKSPKKSSKKGTTK